MKTAHMEGDRQQWMLLYILHYKTDMILSHGELSPEEDPSTWEHVVHVQWWRSQVIPYNTRAGGQQASTLVIFTGHEKKCSMSCLRRAAGLWHSPLLWGWGGVFSTYSERHSWRSKAVVPNTPEGQCTQKMCLGTELVEKAMNWWTT